MEHAAVTKISSFALVDSCSSSSCSSSSSSSCATAGISSCATASIPAITAAATSTRKRRRSKRAGQDNNCLGPPSCSCFSFGIIIPSEEGQNSHSLQFETYDDYFTRNDITVPGSLNCHQDSCEFELSNCKSLINRDNSTTPPHPAIIPASSVIDYVSYYNSIEINQQGEKDKSIISTVTNNNSAMVRQKQVVLPSSQASPWPLETQDVKPKINPRINSSFDCSSEATSSSTSGPSDSNYNHHTSHSSGGETCYKNLRDSYVVDQFMTKHDFAMLCTFCNDEFNRKEMYLLHKPCYVKKRDVKLSTIGKTTSKFLLCTECGSKFVSQTQLINHCKDHFNPLYTCNFCDKGFNHEIDLLPHLVTLHSREIRREELKLQSRIKAEQDEHAEIITSNLLDPDYDSENNISEPEVIDVDMGGYKVVFETEEDQEEEEEEREEELEERRKRKKRTRSNSSGTKKSSRRIKRKSHWPLNVKEEEEEEEEKLSFENSDHDNCHNDDKKSFYYYNKRIIGHEFHELKPETESANDTIDQKPLFEDLDNDVYMQWHPFRKTCESCNHDFTSKSSFVCHEPCYTHKKTILGLKINPDMPYVCTVCRQEFEQKYKLDYHLVNHFEPTYTCKIPGCTYTGNHNGNFLSHVRYNHDSEYKSPRTKRSRASNGTVSHGSTVSHGKVSHGRFSTFKQLATHKTLAITSPAMTLKRPAKTNTAPAIPKMLIKLKHQSPNNSYSKLYYNSNKRYKQEADDDEQDQQQQSISQTVSHSSSSSATKKPRGRQPRPNLPLAISYQNSVHSSVKTIANISDQQQLVDIPSFTGPNKRERVFKWCLQYVKKCPWPANWKTESPFKFIPRDTKCDMCNVTFREEINLVFHKPCYFTKHDIVPGSLLKCPSCPLTHDKIEKLAKHALAHLSKDSMQYLCTWPGCNDKNYDATRAFIHATVHTKFKKFQCTFPACGQKFAGHASTRDHVIRSHILTVRPDLVLYRCDYCLQTTGNFYSLRDHRLLHSTTARGISCLVDSCDRTMVTNNDLKKHMKISHSGIPFNYQKLKEDSRKKKKYVKGTSAIINGSFHVLEKADVSLESAENLRNHFRTSVAIKDELPPIAGPWKCTHCSLKTCTRSQLMIHKPCFFKINKFNQDQDNHQSFRCPIEPCHEILSTFDSLRDHVSLHIDN